MRPSSLNTFDILCFFTLFLFARVEIFFLFDSQMSFCYVALESSYLGLSADQLGRTAGWFSRRSAPGDRRCLSDSSCSSLSLSAELPVPVALCIRTRLGLVSPRLYAALCRETCACMQSVCTCPREQWTRFPSSSLLLSG